MKRNFKTYSNNNSGDKKSGLLPNLTDIQINKLYKLYSEMDEKRKKFKGSKREYCAILAPMIKSFVDNAEKKSVLIGSGREETLKKNLEILKSRREAAAPVAAARPEITKADIKKRRESLNKNYLTPDQVKTKKEQAEKNKLIARFSRLNFTNYSAKAAVKSDTGIETIKKMCLDQIKNYFEYINRSDVFDSTFDARYIKIPSVNINKFKSLGLLGDPIILGIIENYENYNNYTSRPGKEIQLAKKNNVFESTEKTLDKTLEELGKPQKKYTMEEAKAELESELEKTTETGISPEEQEYTEQLKEYQDKQERKAKATIRTHFPDEEDIFIPTKQLTKGLLPDQNKKGKYFESNKFKFGEHLEYPMTKKMTWKQAKEHKDRATAALKKAYTTKAKELEALRKEPEKGDYRSLKDYNTARKAYYKALSDPTDVENPFYSPPGSRIPKYRITDAEGKDEATIAEESYKQLVKDVTYYRDIIRAFKGQGDKTGVKNFIIALPFKNLTELTPLGERERRLLASHLITKDRKTLVGDTKMGWTEVEEGSYRSEMFIFWNFLQDKDKLTVKQRVIENYKLLGKIFSLNMANDRIDFDFNFGLPFANRYVGESKGKKTIGGLISQETKTPQVNYSKIIAAILRSSYYDDDGEIKFADPNIIFTLYKSDMELSMFDENAAAGTPDSKLPFEIVFNLNLSDILNSELNKGILENFIIPHCEKFLSLNKYSRPKQAGDMATSQKMIGAITQMMDNAFARPSDGSDEFKPILVEKTFRRRDRTLYKKMVPETDDMGNIKYDVNRVTRQYWNTSKASGKSMLSFDLSIPAIAETLTTIIVSPHFIKAGETTCTPYQYSEYYTNPDLISHRRTFNGSTMSDYVRPDGKYLDVVSKNLIVEQTEVKEPESESDYDEEPKYESDTESDDDDDDDLDTVDFIDDPVSVPSAAQASAAGTYSLPTVASATSQQSATPPNARGRVATTLSAARSTVAPGTTADGKYNFDNVKGKGKPKTYHKKVIKYY